MVECSFWHKMRSRLHNLVLSDIKTFLQNSQEIGVDSLIVADLGVFMAAKKYAPKVHY